MRERKPAGLDDGLDVVELGYQRHVAVVAHPDRRLMGTDEPGDGVVLEAYELTLIRFSRVCAVQLVIPKGVVTNGIVPP